MSIQGRGGMWAVALFVAVAARTVSAQDAAKDKEIEDLRRRIEALEKAPAAEPAGAAKAVEPVEEKWYDRVKVGGGVRAAYRSQSDLAPSTRTRSNDFTLESGRLYTGGKISDMFSATLNAEFTSAGASVLDAIAQVKFAEEFNVFIGRHLPATDRSNSDGPYYLATWDFPFLSDGFNATGLLGDRENGATLWGDVGNFKYWAGAYEGNERAGFGEADHLLFAFRVQYDFLDAEKGYYLSSTYYGDKNILAVALTANVQTETAGIDGDEKTYSNVCLDFLWEQKLAFLGDGVATVELALYDFNRGGYGTEVSAVGPFDVGDGQGMLALVAILIPTPVWIGKLQPHVRYQGFNEVETEAGENPSNGNVVRWDFGVNYVLSGHNARISAVYSLLDSDDADDTMFTLGTQFQF